MENYEEEKILIARACDAVNLCERQNCIKFVGFLTPLQQELVRRKMPESTAKTTFFGGYPGAERTLFAVLPDYLEEEDAAELISVVEITGRDLKTLRHPDFLGSLLGLGIKREKIGDILITDDKCLVLVTKGIEDYIVENLTKVGRCGVRVRKVSLGEIEIPQKNAEIIHSTVAALRLDSVIAAAAKTSRSVACTYISEGRVFLNWTQADNAAARVKPGDSFSVRGIGRFKLLEEVGETKKGRLSVDIEKML